MKKKIFFDFNKKNYYFNKIKSNLKKSLGHNYKMILKP